MTETKTRNGSCLCGAMTYTISGSMRPVVMCHCTQCRKTLGHFGAATRVASDDIAITGATLKWYRSSEEAERGFCGACGRHLFWGQPGSDLISVWAGAIDGPTGLSVSGQLHPDQKGDYYDLPDVPVLAQSSLT